MSGFCPTGCVCRSAAGSANPRVVPDATATAQTDVRNRIEPIRPRTSSCYQCGDNPDAVLNAFKAGVEVGRREAQRLYETASVERWHE